MSADVATYKVPFSDGVRRIVLLLAQDLGNKRVVEIDSAGGAIRWVEIHVGLLSYMVRVSPCHEAASTWRAYLHTSHIYIYIFPSGH